ncbi:MAG: hypothetical protein Q4C91_18870 [Eubacteriales bacterium]|nr:hypothetical protein [Eubacteriales bacterium]
MDVLNYKCPNCTAGLVFDSKTQKMSCEYCGSTFTVEELEAQKEEELREEKENSTGHWEGFSPEQWQNTDMEGMRVWSCPSCKAEIIAKSTVGAAKCPYCDNPMIMPEQFEGMYLPDFVLPFKKSKKEAVEALKKHYLKKPFLPKVFKDENHLQEIKAVYVPFWLFDLDASGRFRYEGVRTRFYSDGDYEYTERSYFDILRRGSMKFRKIPVDGSEKIDDTMMEAIEPYDYQELEPFKISYLSGYLANKYDVEPDSLTGRVHERIEQSVKSSFRETVVGYDTILPGQESVRIAKKGDVKYALLPVWFLNTRWNGKSYAFVMNGQTGKLIGDLPVGKDLVVKYWMRRHIPLTAAMTVVVVILRLMGVI